VPVFISSLLCNSLHCLVGLENDDFTACKLLDFRGSFMLMMMFTETKLVAVEHMIVLLKCHDDA
jgi:hypothetical protein